MATLEQVEKLKERANVTYDEAKEALQASGDDLLDALIYLEKKGKTFSPQNGGFYSTQHAPPAEEAQAGGYVRSEKKASSERFSQVMGRFFRWVGKVFQKGNKNQFEVWNKEEKVISVPVTVLVVLLLIGFYAVLPLMVIGLFFGCRYRFCGPDLGKPQVNKVMDSAAAAADSFKRDVMNSKGQEDENGNK